MFSIETLLKSNEGKTLEFKRDLSSPKGILKTIVAFSNTAGGTLIIGIEDKEKNIRGIEDPFLAEEKLASLINAHIAPQILPEIQILPWRGLYLLMVEIFPSAAKPHYLKQEGLGQGAYIRVGSTNRLADAVMQSELKRVGIVDSFDKQALPDLSADDLDFKAISEAFSSIKKIKLSDLESLDFLTIYQSKKVPTTGGLILFGKDRLKHFPDAWIQVGRFEGITKTKIFDTQEITSYPVLAIDEVMNFVKKHAMHGIEIINSKSLSKNTHTWSLPLAAIREAVINAVVHSDYAQQGAPIRLSIFDDRVEIENPGLLLFGLTIDELKKGVSKLRNRVIGQVFYRLGLIERWGSGIGRIIDISKESGLPAPLFEEIGTHFRVTIGTQAITPPILNSTDQSILQLLKKPKYTKGLSTKEISDAIGKSTRTIRNRIISLSEKGFIVEIGSSINDPQRKYLLK